MELNIKEPMGAYFCHINLRPTKSSSRHLSCSSDQSHHFPIVSISSGERDTFLLLPFNQYTHVFFLYTFHKLLCAIRYPTSPLINFHWCQYWCRDECTYHQTCFRRSGQVVPGLQRQTASRIAIDGSRGCISDAGCALSTNADCGRGCYSGKEHCRHRQYQWGLSECFHHRRGSCCLSGQHYNQCDKATNKDQAREKEKRERERERREVRLNGSKRSHQW